ncbi:MAG: hypothetical protein RIS36_1867 [Pseudomonadota bacterium]
MALQQATHQLHVRFHQSIREFPRYNRFLDRPNDLDISLAASHCLVEVGATASLQLASLVASIGLEQSVVSKMVASLLRARLVASMPDVTDKRARVLSLTRRGQLLLNSIDELSNARLTQFDRASGIKDVELRELSETFHELSDALNVADTARRNKEHQLRSGIRRMTRAFGLLGRRALGSELNTLEWQTLLSVAENPYSYRPTELALYQGVHKSTMAIALAELERRGFIARVADKKDGRATYLSATKAGYRQITSIETRTARRFSAWQGVTTRQVELLERWMRGAASVYHLDDKGLTIEPLLDESAITQARHATAAFYLSSPLSLTIPAELFSLRNNLYGLYRGGELVAAAELSKARRPRIVNLCFKDQLPLEALYAFLARAADPTFMTPIEIGDEQTRAILQPDRPVVTALGRLFFS